MNLRKIFVELTFKCNLSCVHCYNLSGPSRTEILSFEIVRAFLNESLELGARFCQFTGGEPTIHTKFREMVEFAVEKGYQVEVFTNGTKITKELARFFKKNNVQIAISFYSFYRKYHNAVTLSDSWKKTLEGIKTLLDFGVKVRVNVVQVFKEQNVPKTLEFLRKIGVKDISVDWLRTSSKTCNIWQNCLKEGILCLTADRKIIPCIFFRWIVLERFEVGKGKVKKALEKLYMLLESGKELQKIGQNCEIKNLSRFSLFDVMNLQG